MSLRLSELELLALDCQAGGATPAHGDLLELGWARCSGAGASGPVHSHWIVPRTQRGVPRAVRQLTGWSEAVLDTALPERDAWAALAEEIQRLGTLNGATPVPAVIHFARFELSFLRDLHQRSSERGDFPLDVVCLHAIALRLFPDLPRRNIRALAGYLGHSPELVRRSAGHVEATAFIWRALLPRLDAEGIGSWIELKTWLDQRSTRPRSVRRLFPLAVERRRGLPDEPGVYRFVRSNGDILYVGKATSLKKRVASHFKSRGPATERGLELLTQVHDVLHTRTPSLLEAALLECDEIKRLDPPYNVQLRTDDRAAWFAARDLADAAPAPDDEHRIGPLPSRRALSPLAALIALAGGESATPELSAAALAVPRMLAPNAELFALGWQNFVAAYLMASEVPPARRLADAARALWLERGRTEEASSEDAAGDAWDLARVTRRLERSLLQTGLLVRRARCLALLAEASVAFREREATRARLLVIADGVVAEQRELESVATIVTLPARPMPGLRERQRCFDIAAYDRLRVLVTELCRIQDDGGEVALSVGQHVLFGKPLAALIRAI